MGDKRLDDLVRAEVVSKEEFERASPDSGNGFGHNVDKKNLSDVVYDSLRFGSLPYFVNFILGFGLGFIFEDSKDFPPEYSLSILNHYFTFLAAVLGTSLMIDLIPSMRKVDKFIYQSKINWLYSKAYLIGGAFAGALLADYLK